MTSIELLMHRAQELALNGLGTVSPNPLVGCVIVNGEKIIGEGWHQVYGGPHAEVNAITSVPEIHKLAGSTVVVNLEPCSHHGKTPPCADLLIQHKVGSVVISNADSNPLVAGKGIARLRAAGIEVVTDVLQTEGRELNKRFFTMMEKKRPYIILKWAQTENGLMAGGPGDARWISNSVSRQLVHRWRSEEDAVLVGYRTALDDNPRLNVRDWTGRDPLRIIIDRDLSLPRTLHLFDGTQRTLIFNTVRNEEHERMSLVKLEPDGFLLNLLSYLHAQGVQSLLVEGGASTLNQYLALGLWDEARVIEAPISFGGGLKAPQIDLEFSSRANVAGDTLTIYQNLIPIAEPLI